MLNNEMKIAIKNKFKFEIEMAKSSNGVALGALVNKKEKVTIIFVEESTKELLGYISEEIKNEVEDMSYETFDDIACLLFKADDTKTVAWLQSKIDNAIRKNAKGQCVVKDFPELEVVRESTLETEAIYNIRCYRPLANLDWRNISKMCMQNENTEVSLGRIDDEGYSDIVVKVTNDNKFIEYLDEIFNIPRKEVKAKFVKLEDNRAELFVKNIDISKLIIELAKMGVIVTAKDNCLELMDDNMYRLECIVKHLIPNVVVEEKVFKINIDELLEIVDIIVSDGNIIHMDSDIIYNKSIKYAIIDGKTIKTNMVDEVREIVKYSNVNVEDTKIDDEYNSLFKLIELLNENMNDEEKGECLTLVQDLEYNDCYLPKNVFNEALNLAKRMKKGVIKLIID